MLMAKGMGSGHLLSYVRREGEGANPLRFPFPMKTFINFKVSVWSLQGTMMVQGGFAWPRKIRSSSTEESSISTRT